MPVALERPADAEHGDYATNVALKLAGLQRRPPRDIAAELAAQAVEAGIVESGGGGRTRLRQSPRVTDAWLADGVGGIVGRGRRVRGGIGGRARAHPGRDGLGQPDRADHGRAAPATARTATPSRACSRSPATRSSASTTTTTPARRWSASTRRSRRVRRGEEPPEDGYHGEYIDGARRAPGRSRSADARRDRGDPRALPRPLRHLDARDARSRPRSRMRLRCSTRSRRTAPCGRARARTATTRTACSSAPTAHRRTSRRTPPTSAASTRAASTG